MQNTEIQRDDLHFRGTFRVTKVTTRLHFAQNVFGLVSERAPSCGGSFCSGVNVVRFVYVR